MSRLIRKAAVLGAGVMGAQIAAHLTNANIPTVLFDLPAEGDNKNAIVQKAIAGLHKLKPLPLAIAEKAQQIECGNYADSLDALKDCDVVIEAVAERLDIKQSVYQQIEPHLKSDAIIVSNTSGLSVQQLAECLPASRRSQFAGVHFFNPPRYMHLVELIPAEQTSAELLQQLETFLVTYCGKGVVHAKDTPNFIANRVGVFSLLVTLHHAETLNIPFEIVDALTGTLLGRPKSASFRTLDVVGLDTMAHVVNTMTEQLNDDPWHAYYKNPDWMMKLINDGALGQKTRRGIYKKEGKNIFVYDVANDNYRPADQKPDPDVVKMLKMPDVSDKFKALQQSDHPQAQFVWRCYRDLFHYCAVHLETIATTVRDIDLALRWGFGWQQGPFEIWQQAGIDAIKAAIEQESLVDVALPSWLASQETFYNEQGAYAVTDNKFVARSSLPVYKRQLSYDTVLGEHIGSGETLFSNDAMRLWHQGDDIAIASFTTKANAIDDDVLNGLLESISIAEKQSKALVLWQQDSMNFSLGANLKFLAPLLSARNFDAVEAVVAKFQQTAMALRNTMIPTVAAVRGRALGGGCELLMHCDHIVAAMESYIGLVEVGVGLLPAGGGSKLFAMKAFEHSPNDPLQALQHYFKTLAMAEVSMSAGEAKQKGFLNPRDTVVMNTHEVLYVAKQQANALAEAAYRPPLPQQFKVAGTTGIATLQMLLVNYREGGFISEYDYYLGCQIAKVLCGGDIEAGSIVDEDYLLKLERDTFIELIQQEKTQQRIQQFVETGRPLRN